MNFEPHLQKFGVKGFRKGQAEILSTVLAGKDTLAVLPTGGGKSLCFQLPALIKNELVIVVSPLIALMKDQAAGLERRGIPSGSLHSGQTLNEKRVIFQRMNQGGPFVLYLSPERTQKEGFQAWFMQRKIALIAIDEAHCVSQWGHDFRPEYAQLKNLKASRPEIPVLALTASATPLVLNDIARALGLVEPARHIHGFYRPNLYYQVEDCGDEHGKFAMLNKCLEQTPTGRVIIYCGTRRTVEDVASSLQSKFSGVSYYHAGLSAKERTEVQGQYDSGEVRILVATNAFGMGIDHPDVRAVVHFNLPANIDSLYQEMGRAGRDDQPSTCLLLYTRKDKGLQGFFITNSDAPRPIKNSRWNTLNALVDYAESGECRHAEILAYYKDSQRLQRCGHCDICLPNSDRKIMRPVNATVKLRKKKSQQDSVGALVGAEKMRFEILRDWRKAKATELDVPAFVVFSDRTLIEIAQVHPKALDELEDLYGIGPQKLERFGAEILKLLSL
jgi:ATP-dependent DNA helicase RecQ